MVVVAGPRQAGKSTLAEHVVAGHKGTWLSLDDAATLDAARTDPVGFVTGRTGLVGVDEAQRVPELLLAVKAQVDRDRRPGRFLLTGSTRLLGAPGLADSLAGRMEALARTDRRRTAWFDSYVSGVIDREVRAVTDATYLRELPRLLRLVASRTAHRHQVFSRSWQRGR